MLSRALPWENPGTYLSTTETTRAVPGYPLVCAVVAEFGLRVRLAVSYVSCKVSRVSLWTYQGTGYLPEHRFLLQDAWFAGLCMFRLSQSVRSALRGRIPLPCLRRTSLSRKV